MNLKFWIFTFFCLSVACFANAQVLKFGSNIASLKQNDLDYTKNKSAIFYQFGIGTNMNRSKPGFRAEFLYSVKGRAMEYKHEIETTANQKHILEIQQKDRIPYFDMPLLFTFPVAKGRIVLEGGPNFAMRIGGLRKIESTTTLYDNNGQVNTYTYEETKYKYRNKEAFPNNRKQQGDDEKKLSKNPVSRYDMGLNLGVNVLLGGFASVSCRYNFGLIDVINENYFNNYTSNTNRDAHRSLEISLNLAL